MTWRIGDHARSACEMVFIKKQSQLFVILDTMLSNKSYNFNDYEPKIYQLWEESGYFNPDNLKNLKKNVKSYVILLPPPNVTGSLHMGHALGDSIQDALIRFHRMNGYRALWYPGIDHAGIATQNVVEKMLRKDGLSRWQLGKEKFLEKVWAWKAEYGNTIFEQLRKLGASCDWSRSRFTMDPVYIQNVQETFIHYYKKGIIYRGKRVVSWCPRCYTGISDLEVEYREEKTKLYYIKYPIVNSKFQIPNSKQSQNFEISKYITVATTRPETLLGDAAVAVNPKDKRYKDLVGQFVMLPLQNRKIPIVSDRAIDLKFGTGAVEVTPAHDMLDAEIGQRHNLPAYQIINERGKLTAQAGKSFENLTVTVAREKIVQELEKLGLIEKVEDYNHSLAICARCGTTIEPLLSNQWFLKMTELAKNAIKAVVSRKVKFFPKRFEKTYLTWLRNIKDWCISRQIWWGQPFPVFFCQKKQENENFIVSIEKPKECPFCKDCIMDQSEDVFDTWFSSALWPFAAFSKDDKEKFYPSNVLVTARDIINLWVARMIFSGIEFMKKIPFPDVLIHATVLTKDGKRMSKSLGTGIDPMNYINRYGADATRFALIWQSMGQQDLRWDEAAVVAGQKFANKIWNAARFVLFKSLELRSPGFAVASANEILKKIQIDLSLVKPVTMADKKILKQLESTHKKFNKYMGKYQLGHALRLLYDFFWHKFADVYIEKAKEQMSQETETILFFVLQESLKMIHPFMPFVTEAIYQNLPLKDKKEFLMIESF